MPVEEPPRPTCCANALIGSLEGRHGNGGDVRERGTGERVAVLARLEAFALVVVDEVLGGVSGGSRDGSAQYGDGERGSSEILELHKRLTYLVAATRRNTWAQ